MYEEWKQIAVPTGDDARPQIAFALPTTIIILVPFLQAIPKEIEEAASIDRCSFDFIPLANGETDSPRAPFGGASPERRPARNSVAQHL